MMVSRVDDVSIKTVFKGSFYLVCGFPLCSFPLPVQDPVRQPDGEGRALAHHLPHWDKGGEWRPPHRHVSTVPPSIRLALRRVQARHSHSPTHAICSWALRSKKDRELDRDPDTHGNNSTAA